MSTYSLNSALRFAFTRGYTTTNNPQADVLDVNQSPTEKKTDNKLLTISITMNCNLALRA